MMARITESISLEIVFMIFSLSIILIGFRNFAKMNFASV